jgi:hypothetical protein
MSQPIEPGHGEEVETVLIQHMVRLLKHHHLDGSQAKNLLNKVGVLMDAKSIAKSKASLPNNLP